MDPNSKMTVKPGNWNGFEEEIQQIFSLYHEAVNPFVSVFNSLENSFPRGVLNELRDVVSHLTQSLLENDSTKVKNHLDKAYRHMKRAAVDAFKYAAMAYSKVYDDFRDTYKDVDLSYVNNGTLLPQLTKLNVTAENLMHTARMMESEVHSTDEMFLAYEAALNAYKDLYQTLLGAMEGIETIRLKSTSDKKVDRRFAIAGIVFGVLGTIVGIVGCILGFYF